MISRVENGGQTSAEFYQETGGRRRCRIRVTAVVFRGDTVRKSLTGKDLLTAVRAAGKTIVCASFGWV